MAECKDREKGKLHPILGNNEFFLAESKDLIFNTFVEPKIFISLCKYVKMVYECRYLFVVDERR